MRALLFAALTFLCSFASPESFRIGFYQESSKAMSSADFKIGMEIWIREMAGRYGIETSIRYYKKPERLAEDFRRNVINMAVATPLVFVKHFDKELLLPGVVGFKTSKAKSSRMLVLVRRKDRNASLEALTRRPVALPLIADAGELFVRYLSLLKGAKHPPRFLKTKNGNQAILKLFFKKSDMAVVSRATFDMAAELNPQIRERLRVYTEANLPVGSFAYIRKGIDPALYRKILRHSLDLPRTLRGRQVLILFQTDTVEICNTEDLASTERVYKEYLDLLKRTSPTPPQKERR